MEGKITTTVAVSDRKVFDKRMMLHYRSLCHESIPSTNVNARASRHQANSTNSIFKNLKYPKISQPLWC